MTDAGVKSWVLRYRNSKGIARRFKLGDAKSMSLRAARQEAGRLKSEIERGADPAAAKRQAKAEEAARVVRTVADLLDAYEAACASGEWKPKKKRKRPQTLAYEKAIAVRHIRPGLGKIPFEEVKRLTVKALLRKMIERGIGAQTNRTHAIIRQTLGTKPEWWPADGDNAKSWVMGPAGVAILAEARRRSRLFALAPGRNDDCRALVVMWADATGKELTWPSFQQYLIADRQSANR